MLWRSVALIKPSVFANWCVGMLDPTIPKKIGDGGFTFIEDYISKEWLLERYSRVPKLARG